MKIEEIIKITRTYRRFQQKEKISCDQLRHLIEQARMAGSARNLQPLKYLLINSKEGCEKIFPHLGWAGYLTDWPGPEDGERPSAYIVCLLDTRLSQNGDFDLGIASQNILLCATSMGLGGCRIASFPATLSRTLDIPAHLKIQLVLALGVPKETVQIEIPQNEADIKYWRCEDNIHHVPKRPIAEIILALPHLCV